MRSALLCSGKLADFVAIGQDGAPVYLNADAFRDAIVRSRGLGDAFARFLAKPKFNASFTQVDWYLPFPAKDPSGEYRIISWSSATPEEQSGALKQLRLFAETLHHYGLDMAELQAGSDITLFAHYLTGQHSSERLPAVHFPGAEYVYIVDGQPVITFWGFLKHGQRMSYNPLQPLEPKPTYNTSAAAAFDHAADDAATAPQIQATGGVAAAGAAAAAVPPAKGHRCVLCPWFLGLPLLLRWLLGLLLLLLLIGLLAWLLPAACNRLNIGTGLPAASVTETQNTAAENTVVTEPDSTAVLNTERNADLALNSTSTADIHTNTNTNIVRENTLHSTDNTVIAGTDVTAVGEGLPVQEDLATGEIPAEGLNAEPSRPDEALPDEVIPGEEGLTEESTLPAENTAENAAQTAAPPELNASEGTVPASEAAVPATAVQNGTVPGAVPPELATGNVAAAPVRPLQLSQEALQKGDISALSGTWQTRSGMMDSTTGRPLNLSYQYKDGQGTLTVQKQDGTKCSVSATPQVQNNSVVIVASGPAKCPDNSSYALPKIVCTPGAGGSASCAAEYNPGNRFPVRMFAN